MAKAPYQLDQDRTEALLARAPYQVKAPYRDAGLTVVAREDTVPAVDHPERKHLPHDVPYWVDPQKEVYYLTINCRQRGVAQLTQPDLAKALLQTVSWRQEKHLWFAHLFLIMPDHVHGLVSFPPSTRTLQGVVSDWKRWTSRQLGVQWQKDFFEHRLRNDESAREKGDYILRNPVRAGLVPKPEDWPHVWFGGVPWHTERS